MYVFKYLISTAYFLHEFMLQDDTYSQDKVNMKIHGVTNPESIKLHKYLKFPTTKFDESFLFWFVLSAFHWSIEG